MSISTIFAPATTNNEMHNKIESLLAKLPDHYVSIIRDKFYTFQNTNCLDANGEVITGLVPNEPVYQTITYWKHDAQKVLDWLELTPFDFVLEVTKLKAKANK